jgi:transcriptional regulator with XRE-family HTH domain
MGVGAIMQKCREKAGLSQEKMAEMLNRSRSCISKIENNRKVMDVQTFFKWIQVTDAKDVAVSMVYGMDVSSIMQNLMTVVGG